MTEPRDRLIQRGDIIKITEDGPPMMVLAMFPASTGMMLQCVWADDRNVWTPNVPEEHAIKVMEGIESVKHG